MEEVRGSIPLCSTLQPRQVKQVRSTTVHAAAQLWALRDGFPCHARREGRSARAGEERWPSGTTPWRSSGKWQAALGASGHLPRRRRSPTGPKHYALVMFPYTSGDLHIGHWYNYRHRRRPRPLQAHAGLQRLRAHRLRRLRPAGREGRHQARHPPARLDLRNIENMTQPAEDASAPCYDWSREVAPACPEYYQWNQWFFLQFYERGPGLPRQGAGQLVPLLPDRAGQRAGGGRRRAERCGTPVDRATWSSGSSRSPTTPTSCWTSARSTGPSGSRPCSATGSAAARASSSTFAGGRTATGVLRVFTTRPDTIYGVTYVVLAPEHPLVEKLTTPEQRAEVEAYVEQARRAERDRAAVHREGEDRRLHRRLRRSTRSTASRCRSGSPTTC